MKLTGEFEVMEVCTFKNGDQTDTCFLYEGIQTLGMAQEILRVEHYACLEEFVSEGIIVSFSVLARLIREGE